MLEILHIFHFHNMCQISVYISIVFNSFVFNSVLLVLQTLFWRSNKREISWCTSEDCRLQNKENEIGIFLLLRPNPVSCNISFSTPPPLPFWSQFRNEHPTDPCGQLLTHAAHERYIQYVQGTNHQLTILNNIPTTVDRLTRSAITISNLLPSLAALILRCFWRRDGGSNGTTAFLKPFRG